MVGHLEKVRKAYGRFDALRGLSLGAQDFLVENRRVSPVEDHLTGSLAEPKAMILTPPSPCCQVYVAVVVTPTGGVEHQTLQFCPTPESAGELPRNARFD